LSATLGGRASSTAVHRTTEHGPLLPVIVLNMHRVLDFGEQDLDNMERCLTNRTLCHTLCPASFNHLPRISKLLQDLTSFPSMPHHELNPGHGIRKPFSLRKLITDYIPLWNPGFHQGYRSTGNKTSSPRPVDSRTQSRRTLLVGGVEQGDGGDWEWAEAVELMTDAVARQHGLASMSYTKLLHSIMQDSETMKQHMSSHRPSLPLPSENRVAQNRCLLFSTLFKDSVHPMVSTAYGKVYCVL
jgi:hypothetical protein